MTQQTIRQLIQDALESQTAVFKAMTLEDGQVELIILPMGEDTDFYPLQDINTIKAMTIDDIPDGKVKNTTVLRKFKRKRIRLRKYKFYMANFKRVRAMLAMAGIPVRVFAKFMLINTPTKDSGL